MKREPQCLRDASKGFLSLHGVARELPYLCKRPAGSKSEPRRGLTCIRWGAYGVVGFRGVKDAPKSVFIADASASAAWLQSGYKRETEGLHFDYKKAALGLHRGCTNAAQGLPTRVRVRPARCRGTGRAAKRMTSPGSRYGAREFAPIARNRSKPAFEREIGSPGSRRRDAKRSVHISASPEIALREIASSCSPASSRSRASSRALRLGEPRMFERCSAASIRQNRRYRPRLTVSVTVCQESAQKSNDESAW